MSGVPITLRAYVAADEDAAVELWRHTWQAAYPEIDFAARLEWWRRRWRDELVLKATIVVAETSATMIGYVTVDPVTGYLDQIVVSPDAWGSDAGAVLLAEAKRISPGQLDLLVNNDNARAIRFYEKNGFTFVGDDVNPVSGRPVSRMSWRRSFD